MLPLVDCFFSSSVTGKALRPYPLRTAENRRVAPATESAGSREFENPSTVSVCQQEGDGVGCEATLSSIPASICDLLGLMGDNGRSVELYR